jgi:hypothetical protein
LFDGRCQGGRAASHQSERHQGTTGRFGLQPRPEAWRAPLRHFTTRPGKCAGQLYLEGCRHSHDLKVS